MPSMAHDLLAVALGDPDVRDPLGPRGGDRSDMSLSIPLAYFVAHMSGADFFGLVVSVLVCATLLYALLRGEKF